MNNTLNELFESWLANRIESAVKELTDRVQALEETVSNLGQTAEGYRKRLNDLEIGEARDLSLRFNELIETLDEADLLHRMSTHPDWAESVERAYESSEFVDAVNNVLSDSSEMRGVVEGILDDARISVSL